MRSPKTDGNGEQRQRISDELRQLKQMSKGLRTAALARLLARHAAQRLKPKPVVLPTKQPPSVAA